ncbi:MAG: rod shape-determining protein MreC [Janthinobacterium lividum]
MEQSPPPLFKQGPSALARLLFFVVLAFALLIADARYKTLDTARQAVAVALYPFQRFMLLPRDMALSAAGLFVSNASLRTENRDLKARNLDLSLKSAQAAELQVENGHLRALLQLAQRSPPGAVPAEIQYDARDPFSEKVIIDHGLRAGIMAGAPVIQEQGLIGQVTRVFPLQAEVTLLTDRDQAVPVQVLRTGVRSVIYGTPQGDALDLRFVPNGADIRVGDELVTSGLDGVYPSGLPVAQVMHIDRQSDTAFLRVTCVPIAPTHGVRQMLVLQYHSPMPPRPDDAPAATGGSAQRTPRAKAASGTPAAAARHAPAAAKAGGAAPASAATSASGAAAAHPAKRTRFNPHHLPRHTAATTPVANETPR